MKKWQINPQKVQNLELIINEQLNLVSNWLCANKLSLNIDKSNFVLFHPSQKKVNFLMNLKINDNEIKQKKSVKYLGIIMDYNLNWKDYVFELSNFNYPVVLEFYLNLEILSLLIYWFKFIIH